MFPSEKELKAHNTLWGGGGSDQVPMGGFATSMMGARYVPSWPSIKRWMLFIAHVLPMYCVACYVLACLPCNTPLFAIYLVDCWLVMWLPLLDMLALCLFDAT